MVNKSGKIVFPKVFMIFNDPFLNENTFYAIIIRRKRLSMTSKRTGISPNSSR